jgi:excisionase family DNA binding protein
LNPFSLTVQDAARHFGFHPQTIYDMISGGRLRRGEHYLKIGKKVLIVREAFVAWMYQEDGANGGQDHRQAALS